MKFAVRKFSFSPPDCARVGHVRPQLLELDACSSLRVWWLSSRQHCVARVRVQLAPFTSALSDISKPVIMISVLSSHV